MNNRLRFFFDYHCDGCLWYDNEETRQKFGVGVLDGETYDLEEKISGTARIELPISIRQKVLYLDNLYCESLDWNNPSVPSLLSKTQWDNFHKMTRELYKEISEYLGDNFEIIYKQEEYDGREINE
jgi:hypothetical protein